MRQGALSAWHGGNQTGPFTAYFVLTNFNLFHLYTGELFLITLRANCEKGEYPQLQEWMTQRGLSSWVLQPIKVQNMCGMRMHAGTTT